MSETPRVAAIVVPPGLNASPLLAQVAGALSGRGLKIAGAIQIDEDAPGMRCGPMWLQDLATGERIAISQDRGPGARGCRLDAHGLAVACEDIARGIAAGADLVVLNKFGKREAEGRGLRDAIASAVMAGIPVLTSVGEPLAGALDAFLDGAWTRLPDDPAAIMDWARQAVALARTPA